MIGCGCKKRITDGVKEKMPKYKDVSFAGVNFMTGLPSFKITCEYDHTIKKSQKVVTKTDDFYMEPAFCPFCGKEI